MDTLITAEWLHNHLNDPDLVVLDCSVVTIIHDDGSIENQSGRAGFNEAHIPSAGFADLTAELSDTSQAIEFAPPDPLAFCQSLGALGIGDSSQVVLYDNSMSSWAARVWWMLRWVGFDQAALLDGGFNAWTSSGFPVSTAQPVHKPKSLTLRLRPELIADQEEVRHAIQDEQIRLVDTLPAEFFQGGPTIYARPGHIPTAINMPGMDLFDETGRFHSPNELATLLPGDTSARNITYCGGGILASSTAFAMHRLGYEDVAVYTASLQEWAADSRNPMSTGD